jgi:hypothetical protein
MHNEWRLSGRIEVGTVPLAVRGGKWKLPFAANPEKWKAAIRYAPVILLRRRRQRNRWSQSWHCRDWALSGGFPTWIQPAI